ncbi:MATE family efflux transporter [Hominiventricola filiformis]|uniref:MATE family efflux transporter n=1 Tax=Hominiventricola filiformis TaxID=2885352 RepID=A0AAE3A710_9FIRM|nr:MATE family efflux transporter [Hominiventricola filiformis]MCC2127082.1 MATE family efflux transporter [Hominiventricola filiformis]
MNEKKNTVLMTEGGIFKNLLFFATPLILGNLLQQMYNAVDSIIVGNYVGSNALAAVGAGASLIYLLIAFSLGASVGAGVIVSQYLGAKEKEGVHKAVHTALAISIILGLILTAGGILFSRKLLVMMNTPAEILDDAACYLRIYSYGLIFNVVYNMAAGILNAAGNSRRSLMYLAAAAVVNIFMDLLLIAGLKIGVAGAAIATNFSQAISCILALWFLFRVPADYRISLKSLRIHKAMALRIIQIGLPTGIQNMVISFSNILIQASINQYGAMAVAGFSAYLKIDGFNILPVLSFSMAITTFIGQNYGAGKYDRMKKGMWVTLLMGIVYTVLTGILLLTFSGQIMRLFSEDVGVIAYGQTAMRYFCPFYWILAILHSLAGTVRGTGKSIPPMVVLLVSLCLFRIVWIQLVLPYYTSIEGIFILYPVSWLVGAVLMILYTWKGKWIEL